MEPLKFIGLIIAKVNIMSYWHYIEFGTLVTKFIKLVESVVYVDKVYIYVNNWFSWGIYNDRFSFRRSPELVFIIANENTLNRRTGT